MHQARAWAEIDLDSFSHNLSLVRKRMGKGTHIMVVVKADAYGHGAVAITRRAVAEGAYMVGVGDSHEALELREAGIKLPILILGAIWEGEIERVVSNRITPCIHSAHRIELLEREARRQGRAVNVHLKVDTGMGRLGVLPEKAAELALEIERSRHLRLQGICTHYSTTASGDTTYTEVQMRRFLDVLTQLNKLGIHPPLRHASNSAAIFSPLRTHFNMVRPGICIYGLNGNNPELANAGAKPVLSLKARVIYIKDVPFGTPVGYNQTYVTQRATRLAILPIGYNDGLPFRLSNRGYVLIRGEKAPIRGTVSMDYTTVDVTDIPGTRVGDVAIIIGRNGDLENRVEDIAKLAGTIPYEICCSIGKRIKRIFRCRASQMKERFVKR